MRHPRLLMAGIAVCIGLAAGGVAFALTANELESRGVAWQRAHCKTSLARSRSRTAGLEAALCTALTRTSRQSNEIAALRSQLTLQGAEISALRSQPTKEGAGNPRVPREVVFLNGEVSNATTPVFDAKGYTEVAWMMACKALLTQEGQVYREYSPNGVIWITDQSIGCTHGNSISSARAPLLGRYYRIKTSNWISPNNVYVAGWFY